MSSLFLSNEWGYFNISTNSSFGERRPDLVTDVDGVFYGLFECILCGCEISQRLDSEGVPPERKRA